MAAVASSELLHDVSRPVRLLGVAAALWLVPLSVWASGDIYWDRAREGWFWYQDPPAAEEPRQADPSSDQSKEPEPPALDPADPAVREALKRWPVDERALARLPVKWLKALQDVKMERALEALDPLSAREYLLVHREHFRRSKEFTDLWRLVLYTNPELDPASSHPVSTAGLQITDGMDRAERERTLAAWSDQAGLYFFFSSTCPYCQKFAPILKLFATSHRWSVFAVTQDGRPLPEFPDAKPDNGMADAIGVRAVPAVFLAIPEERFLAPVGQGFLTLAELEDRVMTLLRERNRLN